MKSKSLLVRTFIAIAAALFLGALALVQPPSEALAVDPAERCSGTTRPICGEETTCVGFLWWKTCQTLYYYFPDPYAM